MTKCRGSEFAVVWRSLFYIRERIIGQPVVNCYGETVIIDASDPQAFCDPISASSLLQSEDK